MSSVGIVLGGGGISGAAFEMAALMALELATGWDPDDAEVVVGTSAGAYVAALLRHHRLDLDCLVSHGDTREEVANRISRRVFTRRREGEAAGWLRYGIRPGLRRPGLEMVLGFPGRWTAVGLADWVRDQVGDAADGWPYRPTLVTAFDLERRRRVVFGTRQAPRVGIADAVAASSAVPVLFRPYQVDGSAYADGGMLSGTHADLVLTAPRPLDLVLVLAPMAASEERPGAWWHERVLDRWGRTALEGELERIKRAWPQAEVLVLRPAPPVQAVMRPNPMDPKSAVPTFVRALISMRRALAHPEVWPVLERHIPGVSRMAVTA